MASQTYCQPDLASDLNLHLHEEEMLSFYIAKGRFFSNPSGFQAEELLSFRKVQTIIQGKGKKNQLMAPLVKLQWRDIPTKNFRAFYFPLYFLQETNFISFTIVLFSTI